MTDTYVLMRFCVFVFFKWWYKILFVFLGLCPRPPRLDSSLCIMGEANGSSHQAVSWTIRSPGTASPIHCDITGVHVSPGAGEIEEFFHTLIQENHYPDNEVHIYAGDLNAHVADEQRFWQKIIEDAAVFFLRRHPRKFDMVTLIERRRRYLPVLLAIF